MGRPLVFALNGKRVELEQVDPQTSLLSYLRSKPGLKGTKRGCGEGGCGACVVLLSTYDAESGKVEEKTISSCLAPLCSVDGCAILTTEGLRIGDENHAVHKRLAGFHGSQCGFCTPGVALSLYGCLRNSNKRCDGEETLSTLPSLTTSDSEKCLSGNICRCTGYRPILDACKSFAHDVDVEDLGINTFWNSSKNASQELLPQYCPSKDPKFPVFLIDELKARRRDGECHTLEFTNLKGGAQEDERTWRTVSSLPDLLTQLQKYKEQNKQVQLVVGNTSSGIYKDRLPQVHLDISQIPQLQSVNITPQGLEIGAAVVISKLIDVLEAQGNRVVYSELAKHLRQVANVHVRNRASVGGNLILAQQLCFESDIATILLGADAEVTLLSSTGTRTLSVAEFLALGSLEPGTILNSIKIKPWDEDSSQQTGERGANVVFTTYRASPRASGNAVSSVNTAFLAITQLAPGSDKGPNTPALTVKVLRLAFGTVGWKHAIRASETETFLMTAKAISPSVLLEAVQILRKEVSLTPIVKQDGLHRSDYKASVAVGFLFDFFDSLLVCENVDVAPANGHGFTPAAHQNGHHHHYGNGDAPRNGRPSKADVEVNQFGAKDTQLRLPNRGTSKWGSQKFAVSKEFYPVAQPMPKLAVELQVSGEAVYVDDIPSPENTLHAVYVSSKRALAKITNLDTSKALACAGVAAFIGARDLLPGFQNAGLSFPALGVRERLFAQEDVQYVGEPVGLVLADTYEYAKQAAGKVIVEYDCESLGPPILSIEDAVARESFGTVGFFAPMCTQSIGDSLVEGEYKIENAEVNLGGQSHFYMETQTCLAVPDEDNSITIYTATQSLEFVQTSVALTLGLPMHKIQVVTRRLGGAFGGKNTRSVVVAAACAVAAMILKRPVRMTLDRNTDMSFVGGRHEAKAVYTVDFNSDGKITSLQTNVMLNGGRADDFAFISVLGLAKTIKSYNWGSLRHDFKLCRTNLPSRTSVRAPGDLQGAHISEAVIEHVAAFLHLDVTKVREINMHTVESTTKFFGPQTGDPEMGFTLPLVWDKLKTSSRFEERKLAVEQFNSKSRWTKKGIAIVPCTYPCTLSAGKARVAVFPDGSVVVNCGGTEMGQGLWTKVRQAAAYGLSQLWDEISGEKVDVSRIRIVQNDSLSLPNGGLTVGSTASEGYCDAVVKACEILVDRLKPVLGQLLAKGMKSAPWSTVITAARSGGVDLTAEATSVLGAKYITYGACVSEVTIDVLTGSTAILQSDITYDCGRSLNPAVDIGQIEGSFVQGIGFFVTEEIKWDENGVLLTNGTWNYKPPTIDNIPRQFNVELLNIAPDRHRVLSSKATGEPPLLLAGSVFSAIRQAITWARKDLEYLSHLEKISEIEGQVNASFNYKLGDINPYFKMDSPATMQNVKSLCGLYNVEQYLASLN